MKKVRTLEFYGYDNDSTMIREKDYFPVSKVSEIKNMKYVIPDEDEDTEDDDDDEPVVSGDTSDSGDTTDSGETTNNG